MMSYPLGKTLTRYSAMRFNQFTLFLMSQAQKNNPVVFQHKNRSMIFTWVADYYYDQDRKSGGESFPPSTVKKKKVTVSEGAGS